MMTHELEVSILAAPLAAIDRRTLSQAWYCALGLSSGASGSFPTRHYARGASGPQVRACAHDLLDRARCAAVKRSLTHVARVGAEKGIGEAQTQDAARRRTQRGALAQRIERAFCSSSAHPKRATFSIGRGSARVHVILQTSGARTTLLALCRPEMRTIVARALAQARYALAARGLCIDPPPKGTSRCS
jgi:hypothetical protein